MKTGRCNWIEWQNRSCNWCEHPDEFHYMLQLCRESLNTDGQQFHQYQQNEQFTVHPNSR